MLIVLVSVFGLTIKNLKHVTDTIFIVSYTTAPPGT